MQESPAPSTVIVFGWVYKENPGKCRVQVSVLLISQQQRCKSSDLVHLCLVPCSAVLVCLTERHVDEFSNKALKHVLHILAESALLVLSCWGTRFPTVFPSESSYSSFTTY